MKRSLFLSLLGFGSSIASVILFKEPHTDALLALGGACLIMAAHLEQYHND